MNGHISAEEYKSIRIMSDEDKLFYLEGIVEQFQEHVIESINNEIYSVIVDNFNQLRK